MSSATSVDEALTGYLAGKVTADRVVTTVAAAYYREHGARSREQLQPLMDIIERAHPGVVDLSGNGEKPGFAVRPAERPFPKRYEAELRQAVASVVAAPRSVLPAPGFFARVLRAIGRVFSA
jgi:hypothetical protein